MSAVIVLHGGERVTVDSSADFVVSRLTHSHDTFERFRTTGTYPNDPVIAVCVEAVVAVIAA